MLNKLLDPLSSIDSYNKATGQVIKTTAPDGNYVVADYDAFGYKKTSNVYDSEGNPVQYQSRENNRSDLSGINFNLGLSYKTMLNEKLELITGLTYAPESTLTSQNTRSFSTIVISPLSGQEFEVNNIEADLEANNLETTDLTLPSRISFGAGIGMPRKWFLGAEYTFQNVETKLALFRAAIPSKDIYTHGCTRKFTIHI